MFKKITKSLGVPRGMLEKKSPSMFAGWQTRWVIYWDDMLYWGATKVEPKDGKIDTTTFKGSIHITCIGDKGFRKGDNKEEFIVEARDAKTGDMREYLFRCK